MNPTNEMILIGDAKKKIIHSDTMLLVYTHYSWLLEKDSVFFDHKRLENWID